MIMSINIVIFLIFLIPLLLFFRDMSQYSISSSNGHSLRQKYNMWKKEFSVSFSTTEDYFRFKIFSNNYNKILTHNANESRTYDLGINQFAYLSQKQFQETILGKPNYNPFMQSDQNLNRSHIKLGNLTDIDWQSFGKVSEIKNQGNCDAGYAFSTTSLIETSLMMQNQNILLSQQQIVDCADNYGNFGCNGGSRRGALLYAKQKGLSSSTQYQYSGQKGQCRVQSGKYLPKFSIVESLGCDQMRNNLYNSPLTVAVNAKNWQLYSNGVFNNCPTTSEVNHQIFLVGVTSAYWRLKNSWGSRWGQYGYIRVKIGNSCGICQTPAYGFIL